jgi:hypothetical protein
LLKRQIKHVGHHNIHACKKKAPKSQPRWCESFVYLSANLLPLVP